MRAEIFKIGRGEQQAVLSAADHVRDPTRSRAHGGDSRGHRLQGYEPERFGVGWEREHVGAGVGLGQLFPPHVAGEHGAGALEAVPEARFGGSRPNHGEADPFQSGDGGMKPVESLLVRQPADIDHQHVVRVAVRESLPHLLGTPTGVEQIGVDRLGPEPDSLDPQVSRRLHHGPAGAEVHMGLIVDLTQEELSRSAQEGEPHMLGVLGEVGVIAR